MRVILFYPTLISDLFSLAHSSFLSTSLFSRTPATEILEPRQAPAVIAASDFLRRGYQASVVAGDWLYIDGGEFSFMNNGTPQFQYASTLLSIDLSQNWTNATVAIQSTTKPSRAPNLNSPSLWYHESENLIYSGFAGWNSSFGDEPNLPPLSLWTFQPDGSGSGAWNEIVPVDSSVWSGLIRPGQPLTAFDSTSAWVLGGTTLESSDYDTPENLIRGMVQFDMVSRAFSNSSIQCCNATGGIYEGALQYVPSFGPAGLHIAMGGENGKGNDPDGTTFIDLGTVSVFDPAKREWWNQTTTGSKPSSREEFCTAGIASTNGTYEIFVYAGWSAEYGADAIPYDTINILTLPAFHWISVPYNPENPRHGHSCNAVGGSQIITIGGVDTNVQVSDNETDYNTSVSTYSSPDPFMQGLAIFDMTTLAFSDQFTAGAPAYEQSEVVKQFYSQSNGAYTNNLTPQVSALLQVTHFSNSTSASSSKPSSSSNPQPSDSSDLKAGAIAGIVIGGFVAFLAAAAAIVYLFRRRKASQKSEIAMATLMHDYKDVAEVNIQDHRTSEVDGVGRVGELHSQELDIPELGPPMEIHTH